jgi:hypothetical protein
MRNVIGTLVAGSLLVAFASVSVHACHKEKFLFMPLYHPEVVHKAYRTTIRTPAVYSHSRRNAKLAAERKWEALAEAKLRQIELQYNVYYQEQDRIMHWEKAKHKKTRCKKIGLKTSNNPPPGDFFCEYSAMICQGSFPISRN